MKTETNLTSSTLDVCDEAGCDDACNEAGCDICRETTSELLAPAGFAPELLAPAGNRDAFFAALASGADAVYLGTTLFNARRNAKNFSLEELRELCDIAHISGRRVYLALNTTILNSEFNEALELARQAWSVGIDAAIVYDLGLIRALKRDVPELKLHASTQLNVHSTADMAALAKLGVDRITLARELSLPEVSRLSAFALELGVETEIFVHGALCFCYSGHCLMSSMIGRRSANRGLCAQPCRLPWRLIDDSTGRAVKTPGDHLLSTGDLCALPLLADILATGVASLKIEGRMKSASYVSAVVRTYRDALDTLTAFDTMETLAAPDVVEAGGRKNLDESGENLDGGGLGSGPSALSEGGLSSLSGSGLDEVFARTLTTAYLAGNRSNSMMSYQRPNNRGALVGRVSEKQTGLLGINLTRSVQRGDILEIWASRGNQTVTLADFFDSPEAARAFRPEQSPRLLTSSKPAASAKPATPSEPPASFKPLASAKPLAAAPARGTIYLVSKIDVGKGDRVFRVRNAALEERTQQSLEASLFAGNNGLVPVVFHVEARLGLPLRISVCAYQPPATAAASSAATTTTTATNAKATATGAIVESALSKAISAEDIKEHVCRVGGTPFTVKGCTVNLDENVGLGYSKLHALRAQALENLAATLCAPWQNRRLSAAGARAACAPINRGPVRLGILVRDANGARAAAKAGAKTIYSHTRSLEANATMADLSRETRPWLPSIIHDDEIPEFTKLMTASQPFVANTLSMLNLAREQGLTLEAGPSIPVHNSETIMLLAEYGVQRIWLGPEFSYPELEAITSLSPLPLGIMVSGYQELMVSEHCIFMAQGDCTRNCGDCARRKTPRFLEDRKGYRFPVRTDDAGRSHLYNAVPLDLLAELPRLLSLGITGFLVDATLLTTPEITLEVERAQHAVDLAVRGLGFLPKREGYTTGHLFRGVL